ncbi:CARDB domain-containing protein [Rhodovulum marinum]|uniref:CARDB protein n=1 Tax=Rhodovulum marinum TaxID=320662 RepID=A0A4R2PYR2_9RHOB|nr:CARDB domain-containing protein [Rhodovulum marinum]TCP41403.1 CARDB protein [Rhodovulum marinum]
MELWKRTLALASAALVAGCGADLVVSNVQPNGAPVINADNAVEYPLRVVVTNQGTDPAGPFKVSTHYSGGAIDPARTFSVGFDVPPGAPFVYYPSTTTPLAPGASVTFDGHLVFHPAEHGVNVALSARADSCAGDEMMPPYCRVEESNEGNNASAPITLALP